ncbi:MAG: glycosyltransferase family 4 protein, partial [Flavitalea sp.]
MQLKDHIEGNKSHSGGQTEAIYEIPAGSLDGYTLFRFAHMFRGPHSGGMETYLGDLNRRLLERNALRILQLYLATAEEPSEIETQKIGRGELVWIPSFIKTELTSTRAQRFWKKLKRCLFLDEVVNHDILLNKLESYMINLAVFHWISDDSAIVLNYLKDRKIPFVLINHFQNERLGRPSAKNYISEASGIAGVSNVDVPAGLETKFTNLSDGIDTNFFHPKMAVPLPTNPEKPVILLPSRITEGKGHIDAIKALGWLRKQKVSCCMVFAGPIENPVLMKNLMQLISEEGVQGMVFFNGKLSSEELRNWYSASDIVLLASYSEGLGRV